MKGKILRGLKRGNLVGLGLGLGMKKEEGKGIWDLESEMMKGKGLGRKSWYMIFRGNLLL